MPALLALIPLRDWLWAGLLIALIGLGVYERNHLIDEGEQRKAAAINVASQKAAKEADAKIEKLNADHGGEVRAIQENFNAKHAHDLTVHASDAERLRQYDAYRRANQTVGGAASRPGIDEGGTGRDSGGIDRFSSLEQVALSLAGAGRETVTALRACMADRDALTGK